MKSCKDCKWWDNEDDKSKHRYCYSPKLAYQFSPEEGASDSMVILYGTNKYPGFIVGPDFGCVHFEPKETKCKTWKR